MAVLDESGAGNNEEEDEDEKMATPKEEIVPIHEAEASPIDWENLTIQEERLVDLELKADLPDAKTQLAVAAWELTPEAVNVSFGNEEEEHCDSKGELNVEDGGRREGLPLSSLRFPNVYGVS